MFSFTVRYLITLVLFYIIPVLLKNLSPQFVLFISSELSNPPVFLLLNDTKKEQKIW